MKAKKLLTNDKPRNTDIKNIKPNDNNSLRLFLKANKNTIIFLLNLSNFINLKLPNAAQKPIK